MNKSKRHTSTVARVLLVGGMIALTGCMEAPENYLEAAKRYAEANCDGVVVHSGKTIFGAVGISDLVNNFGHKYSCIDGKGTTFKLVKFKDIPVEYFTLENKQLK